MRDGSVILLSLVIAYPNRPLKYYIEMSGMSRAKFFKAKLKLELNRSIKYVRAPSRLEINIETAISCLECEYPGLTKLFAEHD